MITEHSGVNRDIIANALEKGNKRVYFVGIGGVSMSSLSVMLAERGFSVFGSDITGSNITDRLSDLGVGIDFYQNGEYLKKVSPALAVYSLSADTENGDLKTARSLNIPTVSRAELLGYLAEGYRRSFAVSGSHGKTTVTSLLKDIFILAGKNPTALLGGADERGACEIIGGREDLIFESCEYRNSFLKITPTHQIILNMELDHTDFFESIEDLEKSFLKCAQGAKSFVFLPDTFKNLEAIKEKIGKRAITYGEGKEADYRYEIIGNNKGRYEYRLFSGKILLGVIKLGAAGRHNAENSVAAVVAAYHSGIKFKICKYAAENFLPPSRRNQIIGKIGKADIIYDYAHHPTEIKAALKTLKEMGYKRIITVFCPHTYSRTLSFAAEFGEALAEAKKVIITEIYPAREKAIKGVSGKWLAGLVNSQDGNAVYKKQKKIYAYIRSIAGEFDCLVLMGAGRFDILKDQLQKTP